MTSQNLEISIDEESSFNSDEEVQLECVLQEITKYVNSLHREASSQSIKVKVIWL